MEAPLNPFSIAGKHAIVTGGASGIGNAIARLFAQSGARVTILDLNAEAAAGAASSLATPGQGLACDVSDEASVARAFAAAGPADILVNSAGIAHVGTVLSTSPADFDRLFRVNVRGTYLAMQAAIPAMQERKSGVILNLASVAATAGLPDRFAYSMTKGAVLSMTLSVARDLLADGIRCNCISPARVHTPFVDGFVAKNYPGKEAETFAKLAAAQPIGRMGTPAEIAQLALYLCSDAASFLTGCDYPIDGGFFNLR
jgi:NAD(P)-dependent dehydrogenase (short-subunit alcohol dehydrogenase family)